MTIKSELNKLTTSDIYSLLMFTLYKTNELSEYSTLSQLSYILDKESLLNLCEYYGGTTIRIPTISELELLLNGLLLFQLVDIEHKDFEEAMVDIRKSNTNYKEIRYAYFKIRDIMTKYKFNSGRCNDAKG